MAMTTPQAVSLLDQKAFLDRVKLALDTIANNVYSEVNTTPGHAARALRATAVTQNPDAYVRAYALEVLTQLNLASVSLTGGGADCDATDVQIQNALSGIWNVEAGA